MLNRKTRIGNLTHLLSFRLMYVVSIVTALLFLLDFSLLRHGGFASILSPAYIGKMFGVGTNGSVVHNANDDHGKKEVLSRQEKGDMISQVDEEIDINNRTTHGSLHLMSSGLVTDSGATVASNVSFIHHYTDNKETKPETINSQSSHLTTLVNKKEEAISISKMDSILFQNAAASNIVRLWRSSARDKELGEARFEIQNAQIVRDVSQIHASAFRNFSMFLRSYQLMERLLKVYVYKEGDKPIFHQPHMRGIYASEGWFMKLMKANRHFVVKDAKKAHLFYLPFNFKKLRLALNSPSFTSHRDLENHLDNYVDLISKKYHYWNRTMGADHFLVAGEPVYVQAPGFTKNKMFHCIRAFCNANVARDFKIGKDVSLPVTYVRSAEHPMEYLGGVPPLERHILAFFAGEMHGYLRPVLLKYWSEKETDMKIFGPLSHDIKGNAKYRAYMKSSKYCICAKGYEVHTPRVVESIYFECVPVIISDNYVPPFFEILDWEAFAVFILEKDIPNLRSILLSIPEQKYLTMPQRLKVVQEHFLWHKKPQRYDLFHMILHSVWNNRLSQIKHG